MATRIISADSHVTEHPDTYRLHIEKRYRDQAPHVVHTDKGDLYARVDVQLPTQLSPEERTHYEALAKLSGGAANTHSAA